MKSIYAGMDESYDSGDLGNLVLPCIFYDSLEEYSEANKLLHKLLDKWAIEEVKYDKFSSNQKSIFLEHVSKTKIDYHFNVSKYFRRNFVEKIEEMILQNCEYLKNKFGEANFYIKIDTIFGKEWQEKVSKKARQLLKIHGEGKRNKVEVLFVDSKKHGIVQMADFYAGLYRRQLIGKDKELWKYLKIK